jgi:hypothetical protein
MVVREFYRTRQDGVNLFRQLDVVVDENGIPVRDANGNYVPTGFMIRKVGTDEFYGEAIDVENAIFTYSETQIPIEVEETEENN